MRLAFEINAVFGKRWRGLDLKQVQFSRSVDCPEATIDIELTENISVVVTYSIDTDHQPFG